MIDGRSEKSIKVSLPKEHSSSQLKSPEISRRKLLKIFGTGVVGGAVLGAVANAEALLKVIAGGDSDNSTSLGTDSRSPALIGEPAQGIGIEQGASGVDELNTVIAIKDDGKRQEAERKIIEECKKTKDYERLGRVLNIVMDRNTRTTAVEEMSKLVKDKLSRKDQDFCRDWGLNYATMYASVKAHAEVVKLAAQKKPPLGLSRIPSAGLLAMIIETETSGGTHFGDFHTTDMLKNRTTGQMETVWNKKDLAEMSNHLPALQKRTGINYTDAVPSFLTSPTGAMGIQFQPTTLVDAIPPGEEVMNPFDIFDKGEAVIMAGWYLMDAKGDKSFFWDQNDPDDIPEKAYSSGADEAVEPDVMKIGKYPTLYAKWNHEGRQLRRIIEAANAYAKVAA